MSAEDGRPTPKLILPFGHRCKALERWPPSSQRQAHSRCLPRASFPLRSDSPSRSRESRLGENRDFCSRSNLRYFYCYAVSVASELSAAAVLVSFWTDASPAITITVGLVLTVGLNFLGVRWYGESEVLFSMIKIALFVLLIIVSVVITLGGAPEGGRIGFQ